MFPAKFDYYRPTSVEEAIDLLGKHAETKVLAGGHSLIPMMKLRLATPPAVVDIGRIEELRGINRDNGTVRVGALTTYAELAASDVLKRDCPLLAEAAAKIADPQVRNRGTIGGNVAHADPASDLPAVLLALGASLALVGPKGERRVAASDFFVDLLTTDVKPGEILTAIEFPPLVGKTGSSYLKVEHPASGYAVCGAAAVVKLDTDDTCSSASLCFNGIAPRAFAADVSALVKKVPEDDLIERTARGLEVVDPLGDVHASGEYRVELGRVYGGRALRQARDRARS